MNKTQLLTEVEQRAIEHKFWGYGYPEMQTLLKEEFGEASPTLSTIRSWFMTGGRLKDYYEKYNKEQSEINSTEARALWKTHTKNAMLTVLKLMNKGSSDSVKLESAREILGRAFGSIPKIVFQQDNKDLFDDIIKEMGIIENEQDKSNKTE